MTLGEKIRKLRSDIGLTQEQLANKLGVSRQAITKWESDKGMPDIDNLKAIGKLLNVTVDYLIDDIQNIDNIVLKEDIDLKKYGKERRKVIKDKIIKEKYPQAKIHPLIGKVKLTKSEKVVDNVIGILTSAPFGIPEFINGMKNLDKEFYLVEQDEIVYLVMITDEFMESRRIDNYIGDNKFEYEDWEFIKCKYEVKDSHK